MSPSDLSDSQTNTAPHSPLPSGSNGLIPDETLESIMRYAALPKFYDDPDFFTLEIHESVTRIKALLQLKKGCSRDLRSVTDLLIEAESLGRLEKVSEELAKAWEYATPDLDLLLLGGGDLSHSLKGFKKIDAQFPFSAQIEILNHQGDTYARTLEDHESGMRQRVTWLIANRIRSFQWHHARTPTRNEIMDCFSDHDARGLSSDELSKQLTRMGLNKSIPRKSTKGK